MTRCSTTQDRGSLHEPTFSISILYFVLESKVKLLIFLHSVSIYNRTPSAPAVRYRRPPVVRWADRTGGRPPPSPSRLRGRPRGRGSPPPPPTVLSTVRFLGEYKEGSTNTLNLLPNLCFPRALSCTLHLLLGKPLLRKSEIVLGVSFGTPNTISATWLLHSFYSVLLPSSQWAANHGLLGTVKSLQNW